MSAGPSNQTRFLTNRNKLLAYLLACVRNPHDAEDLLHDVFLVVQQAPEVFADDVNFLAWACGVARHRVLEFQRTAKRLTSIDPDLALRLADATVGIARCHPDNKREDALRSCLERLPGDWQKMIGMRYERPRRPVSEIASRFGRSQAAMHGLLKRIRGKLRQCVGRKLAPEARP